MLNQNLVLSQYTLEEIVDKVVLKLKPTSDAINPKDNAQNPRLVPRKDAARILGISLPTLNTYTKNGVVQGYRCGGRILYKENELYASLTEINTQV